MEKEKGWFRRKLRKSKEGEGGGDEVSSPVQGAETVEAVVAEAKLNLEDAEVHGAAEQHEKHKEGEVEAVTEAVENVDLCEDPEDDDDFDDIDIDLNDLTGNGAEATPDNKKADPTDFRVGVVDFDALDNPDADLSKAIHDHAEEVRIQEENKKAQEQKEAAAVHGQIAAVKQGLIERGEKLDSLAKETDEMAQNAGEFKDTATQLKKKYQNKKWYQF